MTLGESGTRLWHALGLGPLWRERTGGAVEEPCTDESACAPQAAAPHGPGPRDADGLDWEALEEAVGRNPRDLVKSGRQEREVYQQLWETIAAGRVWHGELVNRRKDGSDYPEEQTITPVRGAGGEVTHYIAIKRDLSTRRRFEEALRVSERKFQSVFEQAAVGVLIAAVTPKMTISIAMTTNV